jgi:competence protein ComEC
MKKSWAFERLKWFDTLRLFIWMVAFCFLSVFLIWWSRSPLPLEVEIVACDVGQGDAILVKYGQSRILIDAGPNQAVVECLRQEIFWADSTIDLAVITHWDKDHIGGFEYVLAHYSVDNWLVNPRVPDTQVAKDLHDQIGPKRIYPLAGDQAVFPGLRLRLLWSELSSGVSLADNQTERNDASIAVFLAQESFGFFSAGDLECAQELAIKDMQLLNQASITKISHHGSKTSFCPEFWAWIRPEIAIIPVGANNSYEHPAKEVTATLEEKGVFLWRTDQMGTLKLRFDCFGRWVTASS